MRVPVSILILTKNEAVNLPDCLNSVAWSDDIVVLDSGSSDATVSVAEAGGCRVFHRPFDNWSAHQNWAVRNIRFRYPWVFNLDADERVSVDLAREIAEAIAAAGPVAFRMRRKDYFRNVWLKHATFYPTWLTRLYRPERVTFHRLVNPVTSVDGPVGALEGHIEHFPFSKGISHWWERHNSYSTFEAAEYMATPGPLLRSIFAHDHSQRRKALKALFARIPCRPLVKFLYLYLFHRGFLDGRAGLDYCLMLAIYEFMISLKVAERRRDAMSRPAASPCVHT